MWILPFAVVALAELACRWGGFGGYPPIIQRVGEDDSRTWYDTSRRGTDTFFGRAVQGGGMREIHFTSPKPPGTTRIAFLGESAMQGFPQPLPLTNGSFLEAILRDVWGNERPVEVLNFGATAVASFPVLCILDEVLDHDPDLVVLMVGNNEFYGAYGMASLPALAWSPAGMRLLRGVRGLGMSQWLQSLMQGKAPKSGTLMERAVSAKSQIRDDDQMREAAAKSLRSHLASMVRRCAARNVPVIVCTVPTNERDLAPIGSDVEPDRPDTERQALEQNVALATELLASNPAGAVEKARAAIGIDSLHARAHFILGQALSELERHDEALVAYVRARDLDTMPWRATSAAQAAVRDAAREGAILCDMEAAFRAESPGGAIGWELLDDHVHMSLRGQALFARTLAKSLAAMPEPLHVSEEEIAGRPWETYAERLGHSVYTDYLAASHLQKLFAIDFMRRNNEAAHRRVETLGNDLLARMSDVDRKAVERWRDPSLHGATDRPLEWVVGVYRMEGGDYEAASRLLRVARESIARVSLWRLELTWLLLACNRHLESTATGENEQLCREAIQIGRLLERHGGAENPRVMRYLGLAYNLADDHLAAIARLETALRAGEAGWEVVAALVDSYLRVGRKDDARRLLELAIRDPQMSAAARQLLQQLVD